MSSVELGGACRLMARSCGLGAALDGSNARELCAMAVRAARGGGACSGLSGWLVSRCCSIPVEVGKL